MSSLRLRLIVMLCLTLGAAWALFAWLSHLEARHEVDKLFDAQLAQSAQVLLGTTGHELHERLEHGDENPVHVHEYEQKVVFQIWQQGRLILRSADAPQTPLADDRPGLAMAYMQGQPWRVLTRWDERREFMIQVAEPLKVRESLARHIALRMLLPSLLALPVLALLIWIAVGAGLRPLQKVRREIAQRAPDRLDTLTVNQAPDEIVPLVTTLNELFARLQTAFDSERRFTADAAHELRTPLAALKTQAQVAQRATADAERQTALANVILGVDRASHLVEQLLTLARIDPETAAAGHENIELRALATAVLADMAPLAHRHHGELILEEGASCTVRGNSAQLGILLRNLLDNAIRYTPAGGNVAVTLEHSDHGIVLEIRDTGPGIPPTERERVLQRFYRMPGNLASGSGLGLSIVKRIAELHGARLALADNESGIGLKASVTFPA